MHITYIIYSCKCGPLMMYVQYLSTVNSLMNPAAEVCLPGMRRDPQQTRPPGRPAPRRAQRLTDSRRRQAAGGRGRDTEVRTAQLPQTSVTHTDRQMVGRGRCYMGGEFIHVLT